MSKEIYLAYSIGANIIEDQMDDQRQRYECGALLSYSVHAVLTINP